MCEIPNNVIQIAAFAKLFDGFSIGSNDLTQLTLGVDRDSQIVAFDFDERDPGVKEMIRLAVQGARRNGRHSGLCGQAPSDYPEMAEYLVEIGIDAMSLNPYSPPPGRSWRSKSACLLLLNHEVTRRERFQHVGIVTSNGNVVSVELGSFRWLGAARHRLHVTRS